jgi:salicylate hydroxylase
MSGQPADPVVIAGGGIAGLTAALAFHAHGIRATVLERALALDEVGAGIQLSPNATRILDRVGALGHIAAHATRPEAIELKRARDLEPLARIALGAAGERRWGAPYLVLRRADLQAGLLAAASNAGIETVTGASVAGLEAKDGETLTLSDAAGHALARASLVVGADGVNSAVRASLSGTTSARYTGKLAWRATIDAGPETAKLLPVDCVSVFLHSGLHLVAYPVRAERAINLVAVARGPESATADPSPIFSRLARPLGELCRGAGPWTAWPIRSVAPGGRWTDGRGIALIGDAAHAMSPYAAQGAAMAIEDAWVLARCVATMSRADALARYDALRRPRVERVAKRGRLNEIAWHAWGPVALGRDLVLGAAGTERLTAGLDWLYGWQAEGSRERGNKVVGE